MLATLCNCFQRAPAADVDESIYASAAGEKVGSSSPKVFPEGVSSLPSPVPAPRRQRISTAEFQTSRHKLSSLYDILDETPRTRSALVKDTAADVVQLPASKPREGGVAHGLSERRVNVDPSSHRGHQRKGFGALSSLIEQSPRTRLGQAADGEGEGGGQAEAENDEQPENDINDLEVSILVDENKKVVRNFTPMTIDVSNNGRVPARVPAPDDDTGADSL
jgi:uncharacterized sporulation protein YeaH/YhbH (DUF444 family)